MSRSISTQGNTKVIDWVEQQAIGGQAEEITAALEESGPHPSTRNANGKVYDIPTLLKICESVDLTNIRLRIHQAALQGKFNACLGHYFLKPSAHVRCRLPLDMTLAAI